MTLSGYLFAKLLDGKRIKYGEFLWNRFLRLAPLLFFVLIISGLYLCSKGIPASYYCLQIIRGLIFPTLPGACWSITIEFHFYLLLPILLYLGRKSKYSLFLIICCAILLRLFLYNETGQIQHLAYSTIFGRIDQFLFGMIAFQLRAYIIGRHFLVIGGFTAFSLFFWYFDKAGGFFNTPSDTSNQLVWVYLPTLEGLAYALCDSPRLADS